MAAGIALIFSIGPESAVAADEGVTGSCRPADAESLDAWMDLVERCQTDPLYLTHLGKMLNAQRRYYEASEHLERALLLAPEAKPAQLEYAVALAGVGDFSGAAQLVDALIADPELPEALKVVLQRQRVALGRVTHEGVHRLRRTASLRLGHDSNLLGAPNLRTLTLTLADAPVELLLDESFLPRKGWYARGEVLFEWLLDAGQGVRYEGAANARVRRNPAAPDVNARQFEVAFERSSHGGAGSLGGQNYQIASYGGLDTSGGVRYRAWTLGAGWQAMGLRPWAGPTASERGAEDGCRTRNGLEWQDRRLASNNQLSGRYLGLTAQWRCGFQGASDPWQFSLQMGRDRAAAPDRPGGDHQQYAARYVRTWSLHDRAPGGWGRWGTLVLDSEISLSRDARPYSVLLASGSRRTTNRLSVKAELSHALSPGVDWSWGVEWVRQRSNLELFRLDSVGPFVSLRAQW